MRIFLLVAILFSVLPAGHGAPRYKLTELYSVKFNAYDNSAYGINSRGVLVGNTSLKRYTGAFSYFNGRFTALGDLRNGSGYGTAYAINDGGLIAGESDTTGGPHAFCFIPGRGMVDVGTFSYGNGFFGYQSHAYGINNAGQVVGWGETSTIDSTGTVYKDHAFVAQPGGPTGLTDLGTLGGDNSTAYGINDAGQIVGNSDTTGGTTHAFLYSRGAMTDLGTFGGSSSSAFAINAGGQIAGEAQTSLLTDPTHAFLRTGGAMRDLGTLGGFNSSARALNSLGDVVGSSDVKHSTTAHAFLFTRNKMVDLNEEIAAPSSKLVLTAATGINDFGQITGNSFSPQQGYTAWLLSPIPTLTITGSKNFVTSHRKITVRGKTGPGVRAIAYRIGKSPRYHGVSGLARWHLVASLQPGKNIITIRIVGADSEHLSKTVTVTRL